MKWHESDKAETPPCAWTYSSPCMHCVCRLWLIRHFQTHVRSFQIQ